MERLWQVRKMLVAVLLIFSLAFAAAGCGAKDAANNPASEASPAPAASTALPETAAPAPAFPVTVTDSTGTEIKMESAPQRIVSILPSATEIAFSLGLGEKIVGVSDWDNYPEEVKNIEKIGGLDVNTEKVVSLRPDLILANTSNGKSIDHLRKLGLKVVVLDADNLAQTFDTIRAIAKLTGTTAAAEAVIGKMEKQRDEIVNAVKDIPNDKRKKVWIEVDPTLYTAGKNTFLNELVGLAGGINIAADVSGWAQVNEEKIIQANPDAIFITYGGFIKDAAEQVYNRKTWSNVKAIQNKQVFIVDSDMSTRPGPRLTEALKIIAEKLYPEKFTK